ncbi:glycosyltransferase family 4 protein [Specibacter cremeus]|uniref:glycosyltransferase family 4 protein n=1 Tax=Specibacter cremeus TaxID=1629051 RepID=UPI000F79C6D8|nr:glycosyltransferase family 4 protein [Specibacter cremeus]
MARSSRMKVVVATRLYTPEVGAAAFRLKALVDGLVEQGADVEVVTTRPPEGSGVFRPPYRLSRWPVLRDAGGNVRGYVQYLSFDVPLFFRLLARRADVIVSEPPPTTGLAVALTSALRRRPYVYYAADIWTDALSAMSVPSFVPKILGAVEGTVLRRAAAVVAVSEPFAARVAEFGVAAERITVVGNGVDTGIFTPSGPAAESERPYFVYTGTMSEWQGADVFIEALALLHETHPHVDVRFFGQGTDEPHLREVAEAMAPDRVHFGGVVPPAQAAAWIRGAVGALVSIKPGQGYDFARPTKVYAAAGCGTPVLYSGQGEGAALVDAGALGIAAAYRPRAVADAMADLLADDTLGGAQSRESRVAWVNENGSLAASGRIAALKVLEAR